VIDDEPVTAWQYMATYRRGVQLDGVRLPMPYRAFLIGTHVAQWTSRRIFNGKGKLPSLLVPCRFKARFKPLRYTNAKLKAAFEWSPRLTFAQAVALTWPASQPAAAMSGAEALQA
jgi:hypothetical protein